MAVPEFPREQMEAMMAMMMNVMMIMMFMRLFTGLSTSFVKERKKEAEEAKVIIVR